MEKNPERALMPQSPYKKRKLKPYHIKYYGLIVVLFMMIAAIKVLINYETIQSSIERVVDEKSEIVRQTQYRMLQAYVYGLPESQRFIAHDNGILLGKERIMAAVDIKVGTGSGSGSTTGVVVTNSGINTESVASGDKAVKDELPPWKSWVIYFGQKMN